MEELRLEISGTIRECTLSQEVLESKTETASRIEHELLRALALENKQTANEDIVLAVKSHSGELVGGLSGATSYGWLLIKMLWVSIDWRKQGVGRRLVGTAEDWARSVGCHSAWLDTSSLRARDFYETLGYEAFGRLENGPAKVPAGHSRWFLKKAI